MTQNAKIFIFGAGFTGRAIIRQNHSGSPIFATTRSAEKASQLEKLGSTPIIFDGVELSLKAQEALKETTHLIVSISPGEQDPTLSLLKPDFETLMPNLQWIGYLSTVGVYGNHDGAWVDETSICKPVSKRSHERIRAEKNWQAAAEKLGIPLCIFRLSGIYGRGRNTFVNFKKGTARRLIKRDQVFNRIYVDDIGTAVHLAANKGANGIFNITDDKPAPPQDVVTYAAEKLGVMPPEPIDFATADLSPMARSFYGENKRVSNAKAKEQLGWQPQFPNYMLALDHLIETDWLNETD